MRRRRRRSGFTPRAPQFGLALWGVGALVLIGAFVFFMRQADVLAPAPTELSFEAPLDARPSAPAQP